METIFTETFEHNGRSIELRVRQNDSRQEFEIAGFENNTRKTAVYTVAFDDLLAAEAQESRSLVEGMLNMIRSDIARGLISP